MPVVKKAGSCQARRLGARLAGLRYRALDGKVVSHPGHHHWSGRQLAEPAKPLAPTSKWVDAMMSSAKNKFAAEVRAVEVRMVLDHEAEQPSR